MSEIRWTVWAFSVSPSPCRPLPVRLASFCFTGGFRRAQLLHCRYIISVKRNTIGMLPSVTWEVRHRWSNFEALYLDFYKEMYAVSSYRKVPIPACKHESILGKTFRYGTAHTAPNPANSNSVLLAWGMAADRLRSTNAGSKWDRFHGFGLYRTCSRVLGNVVSYWNEETDEFRQARRDALQTFLQESLLPLLVLAVMVSELAHTHLDRACRISESLCRHASTSQRLRALSRSANSLKFFPRR